jgi:hypothetical protein
MLEGQKIILLSKINNAEMADIQVKQITIKTTVVIVYKDMTG